MKKLFLLTFLATSFLVGTSAQTVITNDYGSPITGANDQTLGIFNLVYYGFEGRSNYGISDYFLNPNKFGFEFNIRMNFEKYGNYNFDIGPNYSFQVWGEGDKKLLITVAAGPSIRMQDVAEYKTDKKGNYKEEKKTKIKFDGFANARLAFNVGRFTISGGYFFWAPEFKFGKDEKADGFNVALGYSF